MLGSLYTNLTKGVKKIKDNPQLIYTIVVAFLITGSFILMAERFIKIANSAQERLVNVRIGSLQDAFATFAGDRIYDTSYLNDRINYVVRANETIQNFRVVIKETSVDPKTNKVTVGYKIIASNAKNEIGKVDDQSEFLFTLAASDPNNSITIAQNNNGERLFKTTRAIVDDKGMVLGAVITTQTLSLADVAIEQDILNSKIILLGVIILTLFLFFRHSKIIDYMDLYKKLKEVDTLKDDFISMASHELRTPLSVIRGYAEFVGEAKELSPGTKDYVNRIQISTKDLDSLVSDILDVSRIEQGRMSFEYEKLNPRALISEVANSLSINAESKGLSISFDQKDVFDDQIINIDKGKLKQILVNIIGNAVKYTKEGSVTVRQYTEKDKLYIRVSDTGVGMSEEERVKLFEKFYRIRNKETEGIRGTGLGLWITAQMVKGMNGKLSVESIKGVGSHFIISFPLIKK